MDYGYIVGWQSDLVYTIKSVRPVCDKPYHMNTGFQQMWAEIKKCGNHALTGLMLNMIIYFLFHHLLSQLKELTSPKTGLTGKSQIKPLGPHEISPHLLKNTVKTL